MLNSNPAKRVAINSGFLYARMAITVFISLYATRLVLNALGVNDFGLFNVVGGAIAMLTFLNNAMAGATQRFLSYAEGEGNIEKQKHIFNVSIVLHIITALLVVILLEAAVYFLFNGILKIQPERLEAAQYIYQFFVISTFFTIVSVPYDAVINAHENMFFVAILGIIEAILKLGIALFITYTLTDKLIFYGLLMAILSVLLLFIRIIYCHKSYSEVEINTRKFYRKDLMKEMTGFAGWSFLGSSTNMIANSGQGIVMNMFFGTSVNAAQGIAGQINGQLSAFSSTMMKALNPIIAKSEGAGNRNLMIKAAFVGSKFSFLLLTVFFIPVMIETPYIFGVWLKNVPIYAIIFSRLFFIRTLFEQLFSPITSTIAAVGNIKKFQAITSILNFFPLIVCYTLFSFGFQPYWNYLVFISYTLLSAIVVLFISKEIYGLSIRSFINQVFFPSWIIFISIYLITYIASFYMPAGLLRLIIVIFVSLCSYVLLVYKIGLTIDEKELIGNLLMQLKIKLIEKIKRNDTV